jgi:hypothetical protein
MPPDIRTEWDKMTSIQHAELLAFDEIRNEEDMKFQATLAGAKVE